MEDVVIVDVVRTAAGRRNGDRDCLLRRLDHAAETRASGVAR